MGPVGWDRWDRTGGVRRVGWDRVGWGGMGRVGVGRDGGLGEMGGVR